MKNELRWQVKIGPMLFLIIAVIFCTGMAIKSKREVRYTAYSVKDGDTLWSIASECEGDVRENVWLIRKENGIGRDGAIYVGDLIYVPCE